MMALYKIIASAAQASACQISLEYSVKNKHCHLSQSETSNEVERNKLGKMLFIKLIWTALKESQHHNSFSSFLCQSDEKTVGIITGKNHGIQNMYILFCINLKKKRKPSLELFTSKPIKRLWLEKKKFKCIYRDKKTRKIDNFYNY